MAELYQTTPQNITLHIKNIYEDGELDSDPTCKDFLQVQTEGGRGVQRARKFYDRRTGKVYLQMDHRKLQPPLEQIGKRDYQTGD